MTKHLRILGVIPARFASSRLPGKPLVDIGGRTMVQRVLEQCLLARGLSEVVVATDDERIADHVLSVGGKAVMTSPDHPSGTDRCHEALLLAGAERFDAVVNIQGDEPFIVPEQIDELCAALAEAPGGIATLAQVVTDDRDLDDAGEVLITTTVDMDALYFSRAAIPFLRNTAPGPRSAQYRYLKHVGLYAYRCEVLAKLVRLVPSSLEKAESLEQLRWLENGFRVRIGLTEHPSFCVDTPADLEEARRRVAAL
ncbi:MAG: 3-deoxy-manno-octulosonate cytidylyltransferase [Flavobacteriales bacterium]|jgi:3-deoxy-manno-octulosonate cytidylyltransferase (CMP-KDO synthetase)